MRSLVLTALLLSACDPGETPDDAGGGDASVDAGTPSVCERALDCDDGSYCNGSETCEPGSSAADARGCVQGVAPCVMGCDEEADECSCEIPDADGDGAASVACGGGDCDDSDPNRYPGQTEVCDVAGRDEDCDPATYGFRDADGDLDPDASCCNGDVCGTDCDDMRPGVNPSVPEVCGNGFDDDCDSHVDEGLLIASFVDGDGDGWGDDSVPAVNVCPGAVGFAALGGDCDDNAPAINPGATEACDQVNNDCDLAIDEGLQTLRCFRDVDGDGFGRDDEFMDQCGGCPTGWASTSGDCADHEAEAFPGQLVYQDRTYDDLPGPGTRASGDWNCDGDTTLRWFGLTFACGFNCRAEAGWDDGSAPDCGVTEAFRLCEEDGSDCFESAPNRTQRCL